MPQNTEVGQTAQRPAATLQAGLDRLHQSQQAAKKLAEQLAKEKAQ